MSTKELNKKQTEFLDSRMLYDNLWFLFLIDDLGYEGYGVFMAVKKFIADYGYLPLGHESLVAKHLHIKPEYLEKLLNLQYLFYVNVDSGEYKIKSGVNAY